MADMTDEEVVRQAFERAIQKGQPVTYFGTFHAALSALPGGLPAAAALLRGEAVIIPRPAIAWLMGETEEFECKPGHYFRGKPPPYWWRSEFRRRCTASPYKDKPPSFGSDSACLICGQNHHNLPCPQTRVT